MKWLLLSFLALCISSLLVLQAFSNGFHLWRGETLSQSEVKKKWGNSAFVQETFKNSDINTRSKMAYDLVEKKNLFIGKTPKEIRALLGDWDGHYFSESYPAYIIQEPTQEVREGYQVLFFLNKNGKISGLAVHHSCCSKP